MKKVVLLFILFVFSLSQADAQEFHFIPRIGLNLANTYPESFADMRPGLNIGVAEEIRFSKLFALEPGVYYSMQGYQKMLEQPREMGEMTLKDFVPMSLRCQMRSNRKSGKCKEKQNIAGERFANHYPRRCKI